MDPPIPSKSKNKDRGKGRTASSVFYYGISAAIGFVFASMMRLDGSSGGFGQYDEVSNVRSLSSLSTGQKNADCSCPEKEEESIVPQVFNFVKELHCRDSPMDTSPMLLVPGPGKVVIDIGLHDGIEFFEALKSGYSVYGFEANPTSAAKLRQKCEAPNDNGYTCQYVNAKDITEPLPPIPNGGYLIEGGAGSVRSMMNFSIAGTGSSFGDVPPGWTPTYKEVQVIPVSEVVDSDIFLFKLDVQGFEYEVLKGAKKIFDTNVVKTVLMEVYPRGLRNSGVNFQEFLEYLWNDLSMMCSSANLNVAGFDMDHPNSLAGFASFLDSQGREEKGIGRFDDFYCFNRKKMWNWDKNLSWGAMSKLPKS